MDSIRCSVNAPHTLTIEPSITPWAMAADPVFTGVREGVEKRATASAT